MTVGEDIHPVLVGQETGRFNLHLQSCQLQKTGRFNLHLKSCQLQETIDNFHTFWTFLELFSQRPSQKQNGLVKSDPRTQIPKRGLPEFRTRKCLIGFWYMINRYMPNLFQFLVILSVYKNMRSFDLRLTLGGHNLCSFSSLYHNIVGKMLLVKRESYLSNFSLTITRDANKGDRQKGS